jgi:hypothetical protein
MDTWEGATMTDQERATMRALVEALKGLVQWGAVTKRDTGPEWKRARAALTKAEKLNTAPDDLAELYQKFERIGGRLADVLNLKRDAKGFYPTVWGKKRGLGLYLTVKGIMEEGRKQ